MASLFISYSRKDRDAARRLTESFNGQNLDYWIDWEGIDPTVPWWLAIEKGIEDADTFVFLLSPNSAASEVCGWEIRHAVKNGKRLIPILISDLRAEDCPAPLRPLNWIYLRPVDDFEAGFAKLIKAIQTDFAWAQVHRQLQVKALEWQGSERKDEFLLRGAELQDAEGQLALNSSKSPRPTDLQREYVLLSRQATDRQRRRTRSITLGVIVALAGLAFAAVVQANRATANSILASNNAATSDANAATAVANEAEAKRQANIALFRQLTARSQTELLANQDRRLSLLFAIEAIRVANEAGGVENLPARQILQDAIHYTGGEVIVNPVGEKVHRPRSNVFETSVTKALSPAGDWLAIGYEDGTIHVWDLALPEQDPVVLMPSNQVKADRLLTSPGGRFLLIPSSPVQLWDTNDLSRGPHLLDIKLPPEPWLGGQPFQFSSNDRWLAARSAEEIVVLDLLDPGAEPVRIPGASQLPAAISPQGDRLLLRNTDTNIGLLWDLRHLEQGVQRLMRGDKDCNFGFFSSDGAWLAADCMGEVGLWSLPDFRAWSINRWPCLAARYLPGEISSQGTLLAIQTDSRCLVVVDLQAQPTVYSLPYSGQSMQLKSLQFSRDRRWLAGLDPTGEVLVWELALQEGAVPLTLRGLGGIDTPVELMAFNPDSSHLLSVSDDGVTRRWDLRNPYLEGPGAALRSGGERFISPDGKQRFAVDRTTGTVNSWQVQTIVLGDLSPVPRLIPGAIKGSVLDQRWLLSQANDGTLHVWDLLDAAAEPIPLPVEQAGQSVFALDSQGHLLATVNQDKVIQIWDLDRPDAPPVSVTGAVAPRALKLSPAGNWLAALDERLIKLWDLRQPGQGPFQSIQLDENGSAQGEDIEFSLDERWLALNEGIGIKLLDLHNPGQQVVTLKALVELVTFSQDGNWLASAGLTPILNEGYEVRLWNLRDLAGAPLVLQRGKENIWSLAFSSDGKWLAAELSASQTVQLWSLDLEELIRKACEAIGSNLSRRQWAESFPPEVEYRTTCPDRPEGQDKEFIVPTG